MSIPSHLISSHLISFHYIPSRLISSCLVTSYPITFNLISFYGKSWSVLATQSGADNTSIVYPSLAIVFCVHCEHIVQLLDLYVASALCSNPATHPFSYPPDWRMRQHSFMFSQREGLARPKRMNLPVGGMVPLAFGSSRSVCFKIRRTFVMAVGWSICKCLDSIE